MAISTPCGYAVLEPRGGSKAIARLGEETVGVHSGDGRLIWYGLTLSAGFGDGGHPPVVEGLVNEAGIRAPLTVAVSDNAFQVYLKPWSVGAVHCREG